MTTASKTTAAPIGGEILAMLDLIAAFSELLKHETSALKEADYAAVDMLQPEKKTLARRYHDQVQLLSSRKGDMPALDLALRERLIRARTQFTLLLSENMQALEASKNSAKRMAERILEIARESVVDERQTHYSAKGRTAAYKSATSSLSVNQEL
jgi:hypothetical protein